MREARVGARSVVVDAGLCVAMGLALGVALAPADARAQEPAPEQAISLHLLAPFSGGLAVQYERFPEARWASWVIGLGTRLPSGGDYASFTLGLGAELRWWAFNEEEGEVDDRVDGGFFIAGRVDAGWAHVWDTVRNRAVGDTLTLTPALYVGWRFDVARTVEITPSLGLALRTHFDPEGRLAPTTRGTFAIALTVGWML